MAKLIRKSLLNALKHQDFEGFRSIIRSVGLPKDSSFIDYELLVKSVKLGCKRITNLLLDKGARAFKKSGLVTPLHVAVTKVGWINVVQRLLDNGASVSDKNSYGDTPLHVAFAHGASGQLIDLLLREYLEDGNENLVNKDKLSFLHIACTRSDIDVIAKLMKMESSALAKHQVSLRSDTIYAGYTPLHFAVAHSNHQIAKFLLKNNPDLLYSADVKQSSPLHLAAERKDVEMIDLILQHDVDGFVCTNKNGLSHLMAACMGTDASILDKYLQSAEKKPWTVPPLILVNTRVTSMDNFGGYTPLHFAAEFGRVNAIAILLDMGADCCATTYRELTVHDVAKDNVKKLLQCHCNVFKECEGMHANGYDFGDVNGNYKIDVGCK